MNSGERDKAEAFERLVEARMPDLKKRFKHFRNLANPYNYTFTPNQLEEILDTVDHEVLALKKVYAKFMIKKVDAKEEKALKDATEKIVSDAKEGIGTEMDDDDIPAFLKKKG